MATVHDLALKGFGQGADSYESGRPGYPEELLGWLADVLALAPGRTVVDLGAGTGKFTRLLLRTGAAVTAVEPVAAMRERLAQRLSGIQVLEGSAEAMPLATASADGIVCAQAFHWFSHHAALQEMHRVLRPRATLGLVWNVRDESVDWVAAITAIIAPHEGTAPRFHSGQWRAPFAQQGWFGPLQCQRFRHWHSGSFEQVVVDRFLSVSFIAALPPAERAQVQAQLRALPQVYAALRQPRIDFPYLTEAWSCPRLDDAA